MMAKLKSRRGLLGIALFLFLVTAALGAFVVSIQPDTKPNVQPVVSQVASSFSPAALDAITITGRVLATDGSPIPNAQVSLATSTSDDSQYTSVKPDGSYTFENLAPSTIKLDASADGFINPGLPESRALTLEISPDALNNGSVSYTMDLTLQRPASLSGQVLAAGAPVAGASLDLVYQAAGGVGGPLEPFTLPDVTTTDAQGNYTLPSIAPGTLKVRVRAKGFAPTQSRDLLLTQREERTGYNIDLRPSGSLDITVVNSNGDSLAAELLLSSSTMPQAKRVRKPLGTQDVKVNDLPAGPITIKAFMANYRSSVVEAEVVPGEHTSVDIILERADGYFGTIQPITPSITQAAIFFTSPGRPTRIIRPDASGRFEWIPSKEDAQSAWSAQAHSPTHAPSGKTPVLPGKSYDLTLKEGGFIQGKVLQSGSPSTSFTLRVSDFIPIKQSPPLPRYHSVNVWKPTPFRRSDGSFTFGPLAPGTYYLRASPEGLADAISPAIVVQAGRTSRGVEIRAEAGGSVKGLIVDASGNPVAGARVELFDPLSAGRRTLITSSDTGEFSLSGVTPGRRSVRVTKRGYTTQVAAGLTVSSGQTTSRTITITKSSKGKRGFSFQGIGAVLAQNEEGIVLQKLMPDSPAKAFGLKEGDRIQGVDGQDASDMRLIDVINLIRGEEGVPVSIEVDRPDQGRLVIDVERGSIKTNQ